MRICVQKPLVIPEQYIDNAVREKMNNPKVRGVRALRSIISAGQTHAKLQKLKAAFLKQKLWKSGSTIRIYFKEDSSKIPRTPKGLYERVSDKNGNPISVDPLQMESYNMPIEEAIKKVVFERLQPLVNLKFVFVNTESQSDIRIGFNPLGGAYSLVGTDCLLQPGIVTMNLGWFDIPTTIHEFCHALGMVHEHQNPKGMQINWNESEVYNWAQKTQGWDHQTTFNNILKKYTETELNGSIYDPLSIMLYFYPSSLTIDNKGTSENFRISPHDAVYLSQMYPGGPETPENFYKRVYNTQLGIDSGIKNEPVVKEEPGPGIEPRIGNGHTEVTTSPPATQTPFWTTKNIAMVIGAVILLLIIVIAMVKIF